MIDPNEYPQGMFFSRELQKEIRTRFANIDHDNYGKRLFFENSGGSLRLKACLDAVMRMDAHPDCGGRHQKQAECAAQAVKKGYEDLRIMFGCKEQGSIVTCLSASQVMFNIIEAITRSVKGKNIVVSILEHPSAYDSVQYYAEQRGLELRVMQSNPDTGGIDVSEVERLVDQDTVLLSCMYSCNITGAINDIPAFVKAARSIKPDIYIVVDAVQHMPHAVVDISELDIDAMDFAPYKYFGCRGSGIGWLSERCAQLPHHGILCYPKSNWELGSTAPNPDLTKRDFILPITFDNMDAASAAVELCKRGVYVYERVSTNHYSKRIVESFGLEGVVRVSPIHCHTPQEMDEFLMAVSEVLKL